MGERANICGPCHKTTVYQLRLSTKILGRLGSLSHKIMTLRGGKKLTLLLCIIRCIISHEDDFRNRRQAEFFMLS